MRFPIDIVYADKNGKVLKLVEGGGAVQAGRGAAALLLRAGVAGGGDQALRTRATAIGWTSSEELRLAA